jgi:hypothetical protein
MPLCRSIYHLNSEWLLEVPIQEQSLLCCNLPTETMPRLLPFNPHSRIFVPDDVLSSLYNKLWPNFAQSCAVVQCASFIKRDVTVSNNKNFRNFVIYLSAAKPARRLCLKLQRDLFTPRSSQVISYNLLKAPTRSLHYP